MKQNPAERANDSARNYWRGPTKLLSAAAVFHVAVTTAVLVVGRLALMPSTFDSNGVAVSFAQDAIEYREDAISLASLLTGGQFRDWFVSAYTPHIKLYSICFALFAPLTGNNILAIEPINLLCYLGILVFVYKIAADTFNPRAALIAAALVALWPTLMLHTTQLLKDPIFIVLFLALIWILLRLATRAQTWRNAWLYGLTGALITFGLWQIRTDLAPVLIASVVLAIAMLLWQLLRGNILRPNLAGMTLLVLLRQRCNPDWNARTFSPDEGSQEFSQCGCAG